MTVSDSTSRTSAVGTATVGQTVAFTFPINTTSDLIVNSRVTATGAETLLAETTNYTVTISGDAGGFIDMVTAVAVTAEIHIIRDTPEVQSLDLQQAGTFNAEAIEEALDKLTRIVSEHEDILNRCLRAPGTDATGLDMEMADSVSRASTYQTYDASGNPTNTTSASTGAAVFGAFGTLTAATASEAAFKTLANLEAGVDFQAWDDDLDDIAALVPTDSYMMVGDGTDWVRETGATLMTSIGISAFAQTLIDDTTAAAARTTLGVTNLEEDTIVTYDGSVVTYKGDVVVY